MRRAPAQQRGPTETNQSARSQAVSVSSLNSPYVFPRGALQGASQVNGYFYSAGDGSQGVARTSPPTTHSWQLKEGGTAQSSSEAARNPVMRLSPAVSSHGVSGVSPTSSSSAFRGTGVVTTQPINGLVPRSPGPQRTHARVGSTGSANLLDTETSGGLQPRAPTPSNWPEFRGDLAAAAHGALAANMAVTGDLAIDVPGHSLLSRWEARRASTDTLTETRRPSIEIETRRGSLESLHAPSPKLVGGPEGSAIKVGSSTQPSPPMDVHDVAAEDDLSEASIRKAARALRMFFSAAQVRAIASAPPSQYANVPVAGCDPDKQPSDLAKSLRLALKLLSQDSPDGSRFRARLLLALASSTEKEPTSNNSNGQSQALCGSIEAQVFGMQAPPEDELVALFAAQSRRGSTESTTSLEAFSHANTIGSTDETTRGMRRSSSSFATPIVQPSEGLGSSSSSFALPTGQKEGASLADTTPMNVTSTLRSRASTTSETGFRGLGSIGSSLFDSVGDLLEERLTLDGEYTDVDLGDRFRREGDEGDNSDEEGDLVHVASDSEQVGSLRGSEVSTRPPSDTWENIPAPQFQGQRQQMLQKSGVWPKGSENLAAAASAAIASNVAAGRETARSGVQVVPGMSGLGLSLNSPTGHQASAHQVHSPGRRLGQKESPRRSRRALPAWGDLKDAQSREPSASRDDLQARSRGSSPHLTNGRSHLTPCRSTPGVDRIEPVGVAWANVQPRTTPSTARSRRSPTNDRPPTSVYPSNIGTGIDIAPLKLQNMSLSGRLHGCAKESPRRSPRKRTASNDRYGVLGGSGHYHQSAGSLNTPAAQGRENATRTPARRTGEMGDRQGSTTRLRRDREGCQRAIAAQFQSSLGPSSNAIDGVQSPGRTRPQAHALDFYAVGKLIGKGAFGKVNVGVHKLTEELTAMKLCERKKIAEVQAKKCLMQEVSILKKLNGHPNTIQLFEVIETPMHVVLVMEFAAGGDLLRYVRQRRRLTEPCAQDLFKQLLEGIEHIHSQGIVHRDIKLENILLDSFGCLKIADFGVAVVVKPPGRRLHEHCGTPSYIAPEILLETGYEGQPVDVWSAGIVLYAMVCGRVPFKGEHLAELKRCILRGRFQLPSHLSEKAASLLRSIIIVDPRKRANLRDCLSHEWMAGQINRAEAIYGKATLPYPPEAGKPDGARPLVMTDVTKDLLVQVADFGFPQAYIEESLQDGRFNHATATFHLLAQQKIRKRAASMTSGDLSGSLGAPSGETGDS